MNTIDKIAQKVIDSAVTGNKPALAVCHAILMTKAARDEVVDSVKYRDLVEQLRFYSTDILSDTEWNLLLSTDLQDDFLIPIDMFCSYIDCCAKQFPILLYHDAPRIYMLGVSVYDWEFAITGKLLFCTNKINLPDAGKKSVKVIYTFTDDAEPVLVQVYVDDITPFSWNENEFTSNDLLFIANMQYEFIHGKIIQKGKRFIA